MAKVCVARYFSDKLCVYMYAMVFSASGACYGGDRVRAGKQTCIKRERERERERDVCMSILRFHYFLYTFCFLSSSMSSR